MLYEGSLANGVTADNMHSQWTKVPPHLKCLVRRSITQNTKNARIVQNTSGQCSAAYVPVPSLSISITSVVSVQLNFKLHEARPEFTADRNPFGSVNR